MIKNFFSFKILSLNNKFLVNLIILMILILSVGIIYALFISPPDFVQGHSVRIMYVHVPSSFIALGIFGAGYPALQGAAGEVATISFLGQLVGAIVFCLCGLIPGYVVSLLLSGLGMLRTPEPAELAGLDPVKVPAAAYPEGIPASAEPTTD